MKNSRIVAMGSVFAALHAVLYIISFGSWRNWGVYMEPIEGAILGPYVGFTAALIGSLTARMIKPDPFWMFGIIAEPIGVLAAGMLFKARWKTVLGLYLATLVAYFMHLYGRSLPFWTILDVLAAFGLISPVAKIDGKIQNANIKRLSFKMALVAFVCIATDSLIRIFLLIPCGLHVLFFGNFDSLFAAFVEAAAQSYIEDLIAVVVSLFVGVPLLLTMLKHGFLKIEKGKS